MSNILMPARDGHWRTYQISIETPVRKGAAVKYISEYLEAIGYTQTQIHPTLVFERGSSLAGIYNPNPKSQKTEIMVDFATAGGQTIIELMMRVNCFGNMPLSKDYEFWAAEISGISDALEHAYVNPFVSDFAAERAMWYNISVTLAVLVAISALLMVSLVLLMILL